MFRKKSRDSGPELGALKKRVDLLERELKRVEGFEQSLAQHELILAKKIADMNQFEEDLKKLVSKHELEELKKELKRFEEHEQALTENAKFIDELTKEIGKVKASHKLTRKHVMGREHVKKHECEDRFSSIKEALEDLDSMRKTHRKKAGHTDLTHLKEELHNRLGQVEYQNKLLMNYLKKVDEILQKKT